MLAHSDFFQSDWLTCAFVAAFSLSNGYCSTLTMSYGPTSVAGQHEKEMAGLVMTCFFFAGVFFGTNFSMVMLWGIAGSIVSAGK